MIHHRFHFQVIWPLGRRSIDLLTATSLCRQDLDQGESCTCGGVDIDLFLFVPVSKYAIFTDAAAFPLFQLSLDIPPTAEIMSAPFLGNSPSGQCCSTVCWLLPKGKEHLKFHTIDGEVP